MQFTLNIDLGNSAMITPSDVSDGIQRSLSRSGDLFIPLSHGDRGAVLDGNGNTVGAWSVTDDAEAIATDYEALKTLGGMHRSDAATRALGVLILDPATRSAIDPQALAQARAALGLD